MKKQKKKKHGEPAHKAGFSASQRGILQYHDGTRMRFGDPLEIARKLHEHTKGEWIELLKTLNTAIEISAGDVVLSPGIRAEADRQTWDAVDALAEAVYHSFPGVVPLSEGEDGLPVGLTKGGCIGLLTVLMGFLHGLGVAHRPLSNSPLSTDSAASGDSVTKSTSPSGGDVATSLPDAPLPS